MGAYTVEWTFEFSPPVPGSENLVHALLDKLAGYHAIAAVGGSLTADLLKRLDVTMTVEAEWVGEASAGVAWSLVYDALLALGIPERQIVPLAVEGRDIVLQAEELARAPERYLGVTEVAELLGVTRQRASELRTRPGFPATIADLASGPVWTASSLGRFLETWQRRPGRPRKVKIGTAVEKDEARPVTAVSGARGKVARP